MSSINNFLVDHDNSPQIELVEYSKEDVNSFIKRIRFYNPTVNEPLHKFWYFINNAKVTKKTNGKISIVFASKEVNLIESIKSLDLKTDKILKTFGGKTPCEPSVVEHSNYPPSMDLYCDNESVCYDQNNTVINYMKIKNGSKIMLYIKLDNAMINETKTTKIWKVIQMKEIKTIDLSANLFSVSSNSNTFSSSSSYSAPPPPPNIFSQPQNNQPQVQSTNTGGSVFRPPTTDQLVNALGKLKKASMQNTTDSLSDQSKTSTKSDKPNKSNKTKKQKPTKKPVPESDSESDEDIFAN